jgi:hypothetical protein
LCRATARFVPSRGKKSLEKNKTKQNKTKQKLKIQQEINVKMNEATLRKLLKANSKEDYE